LLRIRFSQLALPYVVNLTERS